MTEHAIARAKERFGLDLTTADMNRIIATITNGDTLLLGKNRNGDSFERHLLRYAGVAMVAVYAKDAPAIITLQHPTNTVPKSEMKARRSKARRKKHGRKRPQHKQETWR